MRYLWSLIFLSVFIRASLNHEETAERTITPVIAPSLEVARIYDTAVFKPHPLRNAHLYWSSAGFLVTLYDEVYKVKPEDTDTIVRHLPLTQLEVLLKNGYLYLSEFSNGDFSIRYQMRLLGGTLSYNEKKISFSSPLVGNSLKIPEQLSTIIKSMSTRKSLLTIKDKLTLEDSLKENYKEAVLMDQAVLIFDEDGEGWCYVY